METGQKKKKNWKKRLLKPYRLVLMTDETFEPKSSARVTPLKVILLSLLSVFLLVSLVVALFVYSPIKQKLPGYGDMNTKKDAMELILAYDSLERLVGPIKEKLDKGLEIASEDNLAPPKDVQLKAPRFDSGYNHITELEKGGGLSMELQDHSDHDHDHDDHHGHNHDAPLEPPIGAMNHSSKESVLPDFDLLKGILFFPPLKDATVSSSFDLNQNHFGVDLVCNEANATIKSISDGTVVNTEWDFDAGHVITVQHDNNLISIYKHNSVLLKKVGNFVKEGDAIAIVGNSGHLTSGPHLHLELWYNGFPVNPEDYLKLSKN